MVSSSEEIADCMIRLGYTPKRSKPNFTQTFIRKIKIRSGEVSVRVEEITPYLIPYPKAYIDELPAALEGCFLPHLNPDKSLCYLDDESTSLWIIDHETTLATYTSAIQSRIKEWDNAEIVDHDFRQELSSYWQGEIDTFNISNDRLSGIYTFYDHQKITGDEGVEIVLSDDEVGAQRWIKKRKNSQLRSSGQSVFVSFRKPPFVPYTETWPPKSFREFITWLRFFDTAAISSLVNQLLKSIKCKGNACIYFKYEEEYIGFFVDITKEAMEVIRRYRSSANPQKGRHKKAKIKLSYNPSMIALKIAKLCINFKRINIVEASNRYIFSRNRVGENQLSLENKRIALIGCGTIGGYAAHSLVQIGAGSSEGGELHLFDSDILVTGNLGRHLLGIDYLNVKKSTALKLFLDQQGVADSIHHNNDFTYKDLGKRWDFVIDVTGNTEFSLCIARWFREFEFVVKRPLLIHGWVDAYGLAARALKDDGNSACFGCLTVDNGDKREPRFKLFSSNNYPVHSNQFKRSCGKTYMPFSSQPSLSVAGMVQQLCTSSDITFMHTQFSDRVNSAKNQKLRALDNCAICSK
jgi:hypothetical protein